MIDIIINGISLNNSNSNDMPNLVDILVVLIIFIDPLVGYVAFILVPIFKICHVGSLPTVGHPDLHRHPVIVSK